MNKEQKLDKKLAEWAGFVYGEIPNALYGTGKYWEPPDGSMRVSVLPNFTQSLDACFKWLVPEVLKKLGKYETIVLVNNAVCDAVENQTEIALALCKAIEKLIDSEKAVATN